MKKITLCLFSLLIFSSSIQAQNIKFKKNVVYIDGKECLKYETAPNQVSIFDMDDNEIVFLKFIHNSRYAPLYNKIVFPSEGKGFTAKSIIMTKASLVKSLIKEKVIVDCVFDKTKVPGYVLKHDEDVEKEPQNDQINIIITE